MEENANAPAVRRLPDFIGIGPPRTATTWVYEVMRGRVGLSRNRKETDYFTRFYDRGLDWYLDYFSGCASELPMGELSPMYFASDAARDRIARTIPRGRIVITLRDPVDRAWSHWRLLARNLWTRLDFEQAVTRHPDLRESSRYGYYASRWIAQFGRDRVLFLFYEDLESDPQGFVDQLCAFVGAPPFDISTSPVANTRVHSIPTHPRNRWLARIVRDGRGWLNDRGMHRAASLVRRSPLWAHCFEGGVPFAPPSPETDARVRQLLMPEIEAIERVTGRDLAQWKIRSPAISLTKRAVG